MDRDLDGDAGMSRKPAIRSPKDLIGKRFGSLLVIGSAPKVRRKIFWRVRCDCGVEMDKRWPSIRDGVRCGRCKPIIHGHSRRGKFSTEYRSWAAMMQRCTNPNNQDFASYAGRGITVCDRWKSFEFFLEDMGKKPSRALEIERVDNSKSYEPGNCKWETRKRQVLNRRNTFMVTFRGVLMPLMDACEITGIPYNVVKQRLRTLGWSEEIALTTPVLDHHQARIWRET